MVTHLSNVSCLVTGGVGVPSPRGSHTSYNSPLPLDTQSFERLLYRRSTVGVVYLRRKLTLYATDLRKENETAEEEEGKAAEEQKGRAAEGEKAARID